MEPLSDDDLIKEVQRRISEKNSAIEELGRLSEELRATNDELLKSEAVKSEFVSNIRNEFINPISALLPLSKKLASQQLNPDEVVRIGQIMHKEVFELNFQFSNIFAAAEIEAGTLRPELSSVNLIRQIESVLEKFYPAAIKKNIKLTISQPETDCRQIKTDARWFSLIIDNLVSNAIEYGPNESEVLITTHLDDELLSINIIDAGGGIPQPLEKQLFKRFHQLSSGDTKQHKGSGLGLCVASDLAIMLGGHLTYNRVEDQTVFSFIIPTNFNVDVSEDFTDDDVLFFDNPQKF